ncbi:DNA ligase 4 isoform X3 [Phoenix dactylifera]|uniref:DNA ligase IV n=1 Tax=Phoenix dactylifera TaxID=42345 RepID=A0A8B9AG35_PHODC|nr:DNA ligase 4 isoform X3 [Phoenix dactylifera]
MTDETVRFGVLCSMFEAMVRDRSAAKKRKRFRTLLDRVYTGRDYFSAVRLILPALDRERCSYGLKESALAAALVDALGLAKDSPDALRLVNWRKGGARSGANAGNFALVAAEVLQRRQGMASGGLTIKELNDALDQLASKENSQTSFNREGKTAVLSGLIKKTNALEMKWILMIILKDLKLGISEKSIFHEFHADAEDLFNVTCDLKLVCEKLKDRSQRHKRQDIEVGKAVRPQLALRVTDAATAWRKLHGKHVVVECKFDGDRIQIHKNGEEIHFFSRNFLDHPEYKHGMLNVILRNITVERCILDGEMLVWDTSTQRFAEFGSNQEIAKAAREGLESDRQLCYVAFDILYVGDTSVIHQSLTERHDLLRKVVKPLKGRLEILTPNGGLNDRRLQEVQLHFKSYGLCAAFSPYHICWLVPTSQPSRLSGEPCWSIVAYTVEDVERFFKETIENRDEGIVLKDLGSKWEPGDRSGKWLKLKPDYIHAGADLDVLIIGGYFGSGRRGGEVAQFLVGLAVRSDSTSCPKRFVSFCRVGTGLSDEELDTLITKLKPYFRKNEYPKKVPPFYEVTNNSKERPDVWIDSPDKSVILSITSDIRTIKSEVFAAPYSLRFPRIHRVRYDKPWHECLDVQSFVDLVHSSNGNTQRGTDHGGLQNHGSKHVKSTKKGEKKNVSIVPAHLIHTDISGVKEETLIFANMMFYFINVPPSSSVDYFHKIVVENGGTFSMNLNDSVTHCIAAERKGIKYQAAMRHRDIIHYSWVLDCCKQKRLLLFHPKYYLFLADSSKRKFQEEIDTFSDYYYCDIDIADIKQVFSNMHGPEYANNIDYYKKKYCPVEALCLFQGCCVYFYKSMSVINTCDEVISELALRRMRLEITMHGGEVCSGLQCATHLIVCSTTKEANNFDEIYKSFPSSQRHLLHDRRLHVVMHQWLEDSLETGKKLHEDSYNLKPDTLEEIKIDESRHNLVSPVTTINTEKQSVSRLIIGEKRKRDRPTHADTRKGRTGPRHKRTMRARIGNRLAKIDADEAENSDSSDETSMGKTLKSREESEIDITESVGVKNQESFSDGSCQREALGSRKESQGDMEESEDIKYQAPHFSIQVAEYHQGSQIVTPEDRTNERFDNVQTLNVTETGNKGTGEKLEQMVDPLRAILLDMIPSLSQNNVETGSSIPDGKKAQPDPHTNPVKKKVSYKDVAGQLLKDG